MPFSILLGPQPDKFMKKLDHQTKERIKGKLLKRMTAIKYLWQRQTNAHEYMINSLKSSPYENKMRNNGFECKNRGILDGLF